MRFNKKIIFMLALMLSSCGGSSGDDLDKFMSEAATNMVARVEPLPEVTPYTPLEYNSDGALNDPFKPRKAQNSGNASLQPNLNRPKEPLEAYPLETLKFVGSIEKLKLRYGLIGLPDNSIQQVKVGNYVGQNFGMVTNITESGVVLKEIVQDELSGDWVERTASIDLQD